MPGPSIKVIQCSLDGEDIRVFSSSKEASLHFGSTYPTSINRAIKYGTCAFGFRWRRYGEPLKEKKNGLTPGKARKIIAVPLNGDALPFPSISEASRSLGIGTSSIESSLMTGGICKGYRFRYEDQGEYEERKKRYVKSVVALNDDGSIAKEYESVMEASKDLGVSLSAVYACLKDKESPRKCRGYRLRYKQDLHDV